MKICPNCGAKMESDVNFCTHCGTDLRNVPTEKIAPKVQKNHPAHIIAKIGPTQADQNDYKQTNTQNSQPKVGQEFTQAIQNFDARDMWQWFVNSWKHPFTEQKVEKWYGWVTLLAEDILFTLSLLIRKNAFLKLLEKDYLNLPNFSSVPANEVNSVINYLFISIIFAEIVTIAGVYVALKFVYGKTENPLSLINRIVGMSNLSVILVLLAFVFLTLNSVGFGLLLDCVAALLFNLACLTVVVADKQQAIHDRFYGLLILIAFQLLALIILVTIFDQSVNKIRTYFRNEVNQVLQNQNNDY